MMFLGGVLCSMGVLVMELSGKNARSKKWKMK